ncbi:MAG: SDR family oxidoreductase [Candidatus Cloacimonetes bacterium]|nr:SDR family oxidoreductase [Candidatus Cloacimonadota bacterium]MBL7086934.1 SDR family oxidoreductase [Candidatus Cloacimonadota bacterium]
MELGIKNKVALVTASSQGLGKAVAFRLVMEGAKVMICSRNEENVIHTRDEIASQTSGIVKSFICDVTHEDDVRKMIEQIIEEFKTIDILVCNSGGPSAGMATDFSLKDYRNAIELNLMSTINLCNLVVPFMKKQKWGRVINMTSVSVKQPIDNLILSNTSRTGVLGFSKSLSNQVAKYGITVNVACPGYTKTQRIENLTESFKESGKGTIADFYKKIESNIPMGRLGTPEEFANAIAFLASEGAGYITGVALQIDGGFVKGLF